jgi:coenzyme F420-reducing hydrogenase gamma subunit
MKRKLRVGIFSFTGDEGCVITFVEILNDWFARWKDQVDFVNMRVLRGKNTLDDLDVAFIEGAIAHPKEEAKLREIRAKAKRVVAIGSCAINGTPSNHRNFFDEKTKAEIQFLLDKFQHREKVVPIGDIVAVDAQVPGCPMQESAMVDLMNKYIEEFGAK